MEKSKPSEEDIIILGKKIVEELKLEPSVNTLGRWMSHYVAELIREVENCATQEEKSIKQKECFDVILKLWQNRDHITGVSKPLKEMEPLIELLDLLKKNDFSYPYWLYSPDSIETPTWKDFAKKVKTSCDQILELCLYTALSADTLRKEQEWLKNHKEMLSEEELKMIEHLEFLVKRSKSNFLFEGSEVSKKNFYELTKQERYEEIFNKIESEILLIQSKFEKLKNTSLIK